MTSRTVAHLLLLGCGWIFGCAAKNADVTINGITLSGVVLANAPLAPQTNLTGSGLELGIFDANVLLSCTILPCPGVSPIVTTTIDTSVCPAGACPFTVSGIPTGTYPLGLVGTVALPFGSQATVSVPIYSNVALAAQIQAAAQDGSAITSAQVQTATPAGLALLAQSAGTDANSLLASGAFVGMTILAGTLTPLAGIGAQASDTQVVFSYPNVAGTVSNSTLTSTDGLLLMRPPQVRPVNTALILSNAQGTYPAVQVGSQPQSLWFRSFPLTPITGS